MLTPNVELSLPPSSWFTFPPSPHPRALLPPQPDPTEWTWRAPFAIDPQLYNDMLDAKLPITFAVGYVVTIFLLNSINRRSGHKPWRISKTGLFYAFMVLHNAALAVYSALTCIAMIRALRVSFPGFLGPNGPPGAVDALCKMNGPRGYGDAITYNSSLYTWSSKNPKILLGADQLTPDITDVGRIWNEGLAFWGWVFYVSKFYEVVDNVIVVAKGRRVSTLQVYHHAGALLCMWAGIRYMSPPIWMFVMINSGIHAFMYTYYALTTIGIRPSRGIKKLITTLQITQFIVGMSYAAAHLFISYTAPVPIAYTVRSILSGVPSAVSSAAHAAATHLSSYAAQAASTVSHDASSIYRSGLHVSTQGLNPSSVSATLSSSASSLANEARVTASSLVSEAPSIASSLATEASSTASSLADQASSSASSLAVRASATVSSLAVRASATASTLATLALANDNLWLKKLLYRAAGREALAEALTDEQGELFGPEFDEELIPRVVEHIKEEVRHHTEHVRHEVEEVRYRNEYQTQRCLDTEGQAFAIWLNVLYLLPLTKLFLDFFTNTYSQKEKARTKARTTSEAAREAASQTSNVVEDLGLALERKFDPLADEIKDINVDDAVEAMRRELAELRAQSAEWRAKFEQFDAAKAVESAKGAVAGVVETVKSNVEAGVEIMKREVREFDVQEKIDQVKEMTGNVVEQIKNAADGGDAETDDTVSVKTEEQSESATQSPAKAPVPQKAAPASVKQEQGQKAKDNQSQSHKQPQKQQQQQDSSSNKRDTSGSNTTSSKTTPTFTSNQASTSATSSTPKSQPQDQNTEDSPSNDWTPAKSGKKSNKKSAIPTSAKKTGNSSGVGSSTSSPSSSTTLTTTTLPRDPSTISSLASHSHVGNVNVSGSGNSSQSSSLHREGSGRMTSSSSPNTSSTRESHSQGQSQSFMTSSTSSSYMSSSSLTEGGGSVSQTFERIERDGIDDGKGVHPGPGGRWKEL